MNLFKVILLLNLCFSLQRCVHKDASENTRRSGNGFENMNQALLGWTSGPCSPAICSHSGPLTAHGSSAVSQQMMERRRMIMMGEKEGEKGEDFVPVPSSIAICPHSGHHLPT